jgi:hypothetical protein
MVTAKNVYAHLPKVDGLSRLTKQSQSTKDIIDQVLSQHTENRKQAKKIAYLFDGGSAYETAKNIWNFLKYEVPYSVEASNKQSTKTLSRIVYDAIKNDKNDCKHYAGFTGSILEALGYPFKYRFAGYSEYINVPTHVYCVTGNTVCDAVLNSFDTEKPYKLKIDKDMSLYKLSGVEDSAQVGSWFSDAGSAIKKAADKAGDIVRPIADKVGDVAKDIVHKAATLGLAVPRNAFLLLLRFNVHGWATGLQNKTFDDLHWWADDWGGNRTELMDAIKAGAKEARVLGLQDVDVLHPALVGFIGEPVTIASALVTATPIIVKVSNILDTAESVSNKVNNVVDKAKQTKETVEKAKSNFEDLTGKKVTDIVWQKQTGATGAKNSLSKKDLQPVSNTTATRIAQKLLGMKTAEPIINTKTILIVGGVGLVTFLALKNKK